ncbi:MAG: FAD-binding oxidoreductase [Verrucomicrobia bacterium]|nr:FAD-binding oxidoreductase [Verrucomicrobiota bacterium]
MKKIAIIGAGFAGLATAYFLLKEGNVSVTIFEADRIGGGASGVCSGLLHPYPGLSARRSFKAEEALAVTKQLIRIAEEHTPKVVATQTGILRKSMNLDQRERLLQHCSHWGDVEQIEHDLFVIHSGITVLSENYLEGLSAALIKRGAEIIFQKVSSLNELESYDHIVVAAGYGVREFPECQQLKIKFLKGQSLKLEGKPPVEKSLISQGYIAHIGSSSCFELGSTYEKEFIDERPQIDLARELLKEKLAFCSGAKIVQCKAGVRVAAQGHYVPLIEKIAPNAHVFTGLGSRGLLYHGLYGKALSNKILFE